MDVVVKRFWLFLDRYAIGDYLLFSFCLVVVHVVSYLQENFNVHLQLADENVDRPDLQSTGLFNLLIYMSASLFGYKV